MPGRREATRKVSFGRFFAISLLALAGCGGSGGSSAPSPAPAPRGSPPPIVTPHGGPKLQITGGDGQTGVPGTTLAQPLTVLLTDNGMFAQGRQVSFAIASGGGSLAAASAVTDATGLARTSLTLPSSTGAVSVRASSSGLSVLFVETATTHALAIVSGNHQTGKPGTPLAPFVVQALEAGNPSSGVALSFNIASGVASLSASGASTNAQGEAQATLTFGASGSATVTASAPGYGSVSFDASTPPAWSPVGKGISGASVGAIAVDPTNGQVLYAGTSSGRVYRSANGATSWDATGAGPTGAKAVAIAIDATPGMLYELDAASSLRKSTDSGITWTALAAPAGALALATDPSTKGTLYAGTAGGVQKSADAGVTWSATGLATGPVTAVAVDPAQPLVVYAVSNGTVKRSSDGGATWAALALPNNPSVTCVCVDALHVGTIYAGTSARGVFQSKTSGASWVAYSTGLPALGVSALALDAGSLLYASATDPTGQRRGVYARSTLVASVFRLGSGTGTVHAAGIAADPATAGTIYLALDDARSPATPDNSVVGVLKSTNGGTTFTAQDDGLAEANVVAIATDPKTADTLYASSYGSGVFKSTDGGATWTRLTRLVPRDVRVLAIDPRTSGATAVIDAGSENAGVWHSSDGGTTWTARAFPTPAPSASASPVPTPTSTSTQPSGGLYGQTVRALAIDPTNGNDLYAGVAAIGNGTSSYTGWSLLVSRDGGATWTSQTSGLPAPALGTGVASLALFPGNAIEVYVGLADAPGAKGTTGAFMTLDGLASNVFWSTTAVPGGGVLALAPDANGTCIYAGGSGAAGVWRIGTATSAAANQGLPVAAGCSVGSIAVDAASKPSNVYAALSGGNAPGVYRATDPGGPSSASWKITAGGIDGAVASLAVDPVTRDVVYAGTSGAGIFKTTTGGQ